MPFTSDEAEVVSLLVEGVLYGLYTFLFACTIYVLIYKRTTPRIHYTMFTITILMYILATTHLMINLDRLLIAFNKSQTIPGSAVMILHDSSATKNLVRSGVVLTQIILGEIVLIYRCYVAWGGNLKVIVVPVALILGTGASSGSLIYGLSRAPGPQTYMFYQKKIQAPLITTQALVLVNNVLCTGLLAWKLWAMSRALVSRAQRRGLLVVAKIIVQSGLITALTWLTWLILNAVRQPAHIIALNSLTPITGGAYCLIVSRVALGTTKEEAPQDESLSATPVTSVLDGSGRRYRSMEITVSTRESMRVETEMDVFHKDKMAIVGLGQL